MTQALKGEKGYLNSLKRILEEGNNRTSRVGNTKSLFGETLRFPYDNGFPIITTKEMRWDLILGELLWFIEGGSKTDWRMSNERLKEILGKDSNSKTIWSGDEERFSKAEIKNFLET